MAAALHQHTGERPTLIKGGGGIFDVVVDGRMVFSKHQEGRFPEHDEIFGLLET